jgi:hypothetical protein
MNRPYQRQGDKFNGLEAEEAFLTRRIIMKDKVKKDRVAKQTQMTTKTITHLQAQIAKIQAKADDPNDTTPDEELVAAMDEAVKSLADQEAKLERLLS